MARGKYIKPEQVNAVKAIDRAKPGIKAKVLANLLGVSDSSIQAIRRGMYDEKYMKKTKEYVRAMGRCVAIMGDIVEAMEGDLK